MMIMIISPQAVGVHCAEGRGRTGVMCACYLIYYYDMEPWDAIRSSAVTTQEITTKHQMYLVSEQALRSSYELLRQEL